MPTWTEFRKKGQKLLHEMHGCFFLYGVIKSFDVGLCFWLSTKQNLKVSTTLFRATIAFVECSTVPKATTKKNLFHNFSTHRKHHGGDPFSFVSSEQRFIAGAFGLVVQNIQRLKILFPSPPSNPQKPKAGKPISLDLKLKQLPPIRPTLYT